MIFNGKEMMAVIKMAKAMIAADGRIEQNEVTVMSNELIRFGVPQSQLDDLLTLADAMDATEAFAIVAGFDDERKKYVASYLGTIMISDGDVDDKELALWSLISTLCGLPTMTVGEAVQNMANM